MRYTVKYSWSGAVSLSASSPENAAFLIRAYGPTEWRDDVRADIEILDVIPETCEDCTRAARHTHAGEDSEQSDDVHESYWAPQHEDADTSSAELTRSASLAQRYDVALALLAQSVDLGWSTNAPARAALHQRIREFLR